MGAGVTHFEIMGRDGKRSQEFYSTLFGWGVNADNPMNYGLISAGLKNAIGGGIGQVAENQQPYVTFYVEVDNPQAFLDKAVGIGGRVIMPVTEIPNMVTYAMFADPDGNMVGLVKTQAPPPKPKKARKAKKAKKSGARRKSSSKKKRSRRK